MELLKSNLSFDESRAQRVVLVRGGLAGGQTAVHCELRRLAEDSGAVVLSTAAFRGDGPLTVLDRLLCGAARCPNAAAELAELLRVRKQRGFSGELSGDELTAFDRSVWELLVGLSGGRPIVLLIDDFQFVDAQTARVLAGMRRGMGAARFLLVATETDPVDPTRPRVSWELARYPHTAITLAPLSESDIAVELARSFDGEDALHHAPAIHELSGGNPMLVSALVEDNRTTGDAVTAAGGAYGQAMLAILDGADPTIASVARAVAVLDEDAKPQLVGQLTGRSTAVVGQALACLNRSGLLNKGRFRHPIAQAALLESMPLRDRSMAHTRAAELLHACGALAGTVARQLVAADRVPRPWGHAVLIDAAEHALERGEASFATRCLHLAHRSGEARERQNVASALVRAGWRVSPSEAARHVSALREAAVAGTLVRRDAMTLIRYALWNGEAELATAALRVLTAPPDALDSRQRAELRIAWEWLYGSAPPELVENEAVDDPWARTVAALGTMWTRGDNPVARSAAETLLRNTRLADCSLELVVTAVAVLVGGEASERAERWCDDLLETAIARGAVTWEALLRMMRAHLSFRRGELMKAAAQAESALAMLDPRGWGVMIGVPLASVVRLNTAIGRHDQAARALAHPVPEAMFGTVAGLRYLFARGNHHLVNGQLLAAITDFGQCERLSAKLERDLPAMIPWRSGLAEARLRMGDVEAARRLITEQLDRIDPADTRMRGNTLRLLAAASGEEERVALLDEAVACLVGVGDPGELTAAVSALADLHGEGEAAWGGLRALTDEPGLAALVSTVSRVHQARGEFDRVRALSTWLRDGPASPTAEPRAPRLSEAERRVAELAARGHSNREIGSKLYVTISTVEQHLTRVYRKLGVAGRAQLPVELTI